MVSVEARLSNSYKRAPQFFNQIVNSCNIQYWLLVYCKCVYYWSRHIKEDNILLSNFVMVGEEIGFKKENEKSFYSLILLEQRFPLKIFLAKYVRILVKSVQLGYSLGNLSDPPGIYQRIGNRHMIPRNCFIWELNTKYFMRKERYKTASNFCHTFRQQKEFYIITQKMNIWFKILWWSKVRIR